MNCEKLNALLITTFQKGNLAISSNLGLRKVNLSWPTLEEICKNNWEQQVIEVLRDVLPKDASIYSQFREPIQMREQSGNYYLVFASQEWDNISTNEDYLEYGTLLFGQDIKGIYLSFEEIKE